MARSVLINEALSRLHPEADKPYFKNAQDRLSALYFSGLRELLEQPRDYARIFNTVIAIEPALRGEVVLADIIGLAALMVKAPRVYELMRAEPRWFVGRLPNDQAVAKKHEETLKAGVSHRTEAINGSGHPNATRKLIHHLFPLTAKADDEFTMGRVRDVEGHIAAPARLLVALQLHVSGADVSLVIARRYLLHPGHRDQIASALTERNCLEFLECLGDIAESTAADGVTGVEQLCLGIARMVETGPFPSRSRERTGPFLIGAEDAAVRALRVITAAAMVETASEIAERIVADPDALTLGTQLFGTSYLVEEKPEIMLCCRPESRADLKIKLSTNILKAAEAGVLLEICNPGLVLWGVRMMSPETCPYLFSALKQSDPSLDRFALVLFRGAYDSTKGQRYTLPEDITKVESFCPLSELKEHAAARLADPALTYPTRAAWRAVLEGKTLYGVDGSACE